VNGFHELIVKCSALPSGSPCSDTTFGRVRGISGLIDKTVDGMSTINRPRNKID
jgi:hypothetical protein